jgi:hypothetical protein
MNSDEHINTYLRIRVDQVDRVCIFQKIVGGDDLTRDDLEMILRILADGVYAEWAVGLTSQTSLPKRIKGYSVNGSGRKNGIKISAGSAFDRYIKIADDYASLRKNHTESETLYILSEESIDRYGVKKKYSYKSIHGLRLKGEKILKDMGAS